MRAALGIEQWLTLGHSFGGLLQMAYAQRHPKVIRGMIMINCSLDLGASSAAALPKAREILREHDPTCQVDESLPMTEQLMWVYQQLRERDLFWKMGYAALENKQRMDASFADIPAWNDDLEDQLPIESYMVDFKPATSALSMPVLFFYGQTDWMIGPEHYRDVEFPNMLLWPSAVGHMPFLENPANLETAIDSYCTRFGI